MRISDWSSDVCSSDLARIAEGDLEECIGAARTYPAAPCGQLERIGANARARTGHHDQVGRSRQFARLDEQRIFGRGHFPRSEEHTSELQSLMRISYAVFCLKKKNNTIKTSQHSI